MKTYVTITNIELDDEDTLKCKVEITRDNITEKHVSTDIFSTDSNWNGTMEDIYRFVLEKLGCNIRFSKNSAYPEKLVKNDIVLSQNDSKCICDFYYSHNHIKTIQCVSFEKALQTVLKDRVSSLVFLNEKSDIQNAVRI